MSSSFMIRNVLVHDHHHQYCYAPTMHLSTRIPISKTTHKMFSPLFSKNYCSSSYNYPRSFSTLSAYSGDKLIRPDNRAETAGSDSKPKKEAFKFTDVLWTFLRPHTLFGTALASTSLAARAWIESEHLMCWSLLLKAVPGFIALLFANSYIVGINQIYDVEIDKVNKPYLPIAAGDISLRSAWALVTFFAATGTLLVGSNAGLLLTSLYCFALLLGTIYSVPPFRMKRFPVATFLMISTVRGFLINFGVYYASRAALGVAFEWSPALVFITIFVTLFALAIAITKDLPDVEGDRKFNISTFATKLGVRNIAFLGSGLLLFNYIASILAAIYMPQAFNHHILIPTHAILGLSLVFRAWVLEQSKYTNEAISEFYLFLWKLLYAEYIVLPFI